MTKRQCTRCGRRFAARTPDQSVCADCRAQMRATTLAERTCRACGAQFSGGPRAWYCPACRAARARAAKRAHRERLARSLAVRFGSLRTCAVCGAEFAIRSARQSYCSRCAAAAVTAIDREQARTRQARLGNPHSRPVRVCAVCGATIPRGRRADTCSDVCARRLKSFWQATADHKRGRRKSPPEAL